MKVYYNGNLAYNFPNSKKVKGELGNRLYGINLFNIKGKLEVGPIYLPLISMETIGGMTIIQVSNRNRPILILVLTKHRPFIHIERIAPDDAITEYYDEEK